MCILTLDDITPQDTTIGFFRVSPERLGMIYANKLFNHNIHDDAFMVIPVSGDVLWLGEIDSNEWSKFMFATCFTERFPFADGDQCDGVSIKHFDTHSFMGDTMLARDVSGFLRINTKHVFEGAKEAIRGLSPDQQCVVVRIKDKEKFKGNIVVITKSEIDTIESGAKIVVPVVHEDQKKELHQDFTVILMGVLAYLYTCENLWGHDYKHSEIYSQWNTEERDFLIGIDEAQPSKISLKNSRTFRVCGKGKNDIGELRRLSSSDHQDWYRNKFPYKIMENGTISGTTLSANPENYSYTIDERGMTRFKKFMEQNQRFYYSY